MSEPAKKSFTKDEAALAIQSTYRSYCCRRELAGLTLRASTKQRWSNLYDYIRQEQINSLSQKDGVHTINEKWRTAEFASSRVGKGILRASSPPLSLLASHWLELVDSPHRYGANLHIYHTYWLSLPTSQSFFYWLDHGDGKDLSLPDCSREKLESEQITYLNPEQRKQYTVIVKDGLLIREVTNEPVQTVFDNPTEKSHKFIYVTDTDLNFYVGEKIRGKFHHTSFLSGGVICAAGGITIDNGRLLKITPSSGHYHPQKRHFETLLHKLEAEGISLANVDIVWDFKLEGEKEDKGAAKTAKVAADNGPDVNGQVKEKNTEGKVEVKADSIKAVAKP